MTDYLKASQVTIEYPKHDIPNDGACVPCESMNACCEFEGEIVDFDNDTRSISWPYESLDPFATKRLLILANSIREGNTLVGKVNLTRSGGECRDATENRITLKLDDQSGSRYESARSLQGVDVTTEGNSMLWMLAQNAGIASNRAFGWNTPPLLAIFALGQMITDLSRRLSASPALTVTPQMCVNHPSCVIPFDVIAIPEFKVEGSMEWAAMVVLNSVSPYITRKYEDDPKLTLTYAGENMTWSPTSGSTDSDNDNTPSAGVLRLLDRVVERLSAFQTEQTRAKEDAIRQGQAPLLNNTVGSRVEISIKLTAGAEAELKAKDSTPDLLLKCSSFNLGLKFGIKGTIDCIQVASTALSPGIERAITQARQRASRENQRFNGYVKADLIFGSQSNIDIKFANTDITLYAEPSKENGDRVETNPFDCIGGIRFVAKAELGVHVGAEAWGVKAEAGAFGSLHTAWQVQVRTGASTDPNNPCEYRLFFEGLVAEVNLYARLEGDKNAAGGGGVGDDDHEIKTESNLNKDKRTLFQRVDEHLSEAQTKQAGFDQQSAQANQHSTMNVAEAKRVLRTYDFGGNLTRLGRLEELETSLKNFPDNEENQAALDKLLAEISEEYDERFSPKEELGVYQLLQPTVNPITDESPRWQGFDPFFWRT